MLVRFLRFSFRFFRWLRRSLSSALSSSGFGLLGFCFVVFFAVPFWSCFFVVVSPWLFLCLALRRFCFVRFPRPFAPSVSSPLFVPRLGGWGCRWACVPVSALSAVRACGAVWARPAVVARRSGLLLFVWVWLPAGFVPEPAEETKTKIKTKSSAANAASEKARILASKVKLDLKRGITLQTHFVAASLILRKNRNIKHILTIPP